MKEYFQTDKGQIRDHNEDDGGVFYNEAGQMLAVIADGMGGHQAGDVASRMATLFIRDKWEPLTGLNSAEETETWLTNILQETNRAIHEEALEHEAYAGMGTTVVAAVCTNQFMTVSHIGDSRCYLHSEQGLKQLTEDHSLVNELVRSGRISPEEAEQHPRKNVLLKAVGTEGVAVPDVQTIEWTSGNQLLLCTDGLTDKLTDNEIETFMQKEQEPDIIGNDMIKRANEQGGEDNISLLIIRHDDRVQAGDA
ncbi:Stp1/IreP family PP2C-type Ser/Thr phosphatase [Lentibacillus kimchii]|uniref:Stp1/IreP family PP2C-type Ser/Thr phosphatase n=1 Tax=Lentibacillus kimchii TaxID=1542911 RepID=A0ABW2UT76_9BACI